MFLNIQEEWQQRLDRTGLALHEPLSIIQINSGSGTNRKANFLVLNGKLESVLILKLARCAQARARLVHEFETLMELSGFPGLRRSVPKPLALAPSVEKLILAESCVPGISLTLLLRRPWKVKREQVERQLLSAIGWLRQFQNATRAGTKIFPGKAAVETLYSVLEQFGRVSKLPASFIRTLKELAEAHAGLELPLAARHGDFWPGNMLVDAENIGVIDWECYREAEFPFYDLFLFTTAYARAYPWREFRRLSKSDVFHKSFIEKNWFSDLILAAVADYFQTLPGVSIHLFFSLFLMEMAAGGSAHGEMLSGEWNDLLNIYAENQRASIFSGL